MATNNVNEKTEKIFLEELDRLKVLTFGDKLAKNILSLFKSLDSLAASTIFEHSIAKVNKHIQKDSTFGRDFTDGSDAKLTTAVSYKKVRECGVNCFGKIGAIRIMSYESVTKKFYYFYVPRDKYSEIIKIPFDLDGTPKRVNRLGTNKIWECECSSFKDMARR